MTGGAVPLSMVAEPGGVLRRARLAAGCSQLDLALRLGVSQRHLSFVERGRARPSRNLILAWMREAAAPPALTNAALNRAGYVSIDSGEAGPSPACAALRQVLDVHEPYPALVFGPDWVIIKANVAGQWLCRALMPEATGHLASTESGLDMIATLAHPDGLMARMRDPWVAGGALLDQLRNEEWAWPGLKPRTDAFEASLLARFGPRPPSVRRAAGEPCLNLVFDTPLGALSFFTIQSVFALPQDVTPASLRIELWFPADEATRAVMRARRGLRMPVGAAAL
jgi:transcriptional regulator with XRE-family HTH domain